MGDIRAQVDRVAGRRSQAPSRRWARRLATSTLFFLGACGGDATGPKGPSPNDPAAGVFALSTVNALPLPFNFFKATGYSLDLSAVTLALQVNGNYLMTQTTTETVAGFTSTYLDTLRGTWTQNAGSLSIRGNDSTVTAATWDGREIQMSLNSEGQTLRSVFRKTP